MTTTASPSSIEQRNDATASPHDGYGEDGYAVRNGRAKSATANAVNWPDLPTFPLDVGWREVYDPATNSYLQLPLTLLDILFPTEDDVDVVFMAQSPLHDLWLRWLSAMMQTYLSIQKLITHDVLIHWGRRGAPPKSPDIAVMPEGRLPAEDQKSYRVGRDGPPPTFIIEITSEETRLVDLNVKPIFYAAVGVKEFLIIDILTKHDQPWRLLGYRLEDNPYYQELTSDDDGSLIFPTIGLRFRAVGRERIEVYSLATGARLLTPEELKVYADAETARANAEAARANVEAARAEQEAAARHAIETELATARARLRTLEARYNVQAENQPTTKNDLD